MSSVHLIIVARNDKTAEIQLPLGSVTLYGCEPEGEALLLKQICAKYDDSWTIAIYAPDGAFYSGRKK